MTIGHRSGGGAKGGAGVEGEPLGNGNPFSDLGVTSDPESPTSVSAKLANDSGKLTMKAGMQIILS